VTTELRIDERGLSARDLDEAAGLASRAFVDDEYFSYLLPDNRSRPRSLAMLFRSQIGHLGENHRLVTVRDPHDAIVGVASWLPTNRYPLPLREQLAQVPGQLRALYRHPRSLRIGGAYVKSLVRIHPKEPHWYLVLLAVEPAHQRSGVGTLLVRDGLARVDDEHVGAYLETQKEENHAYYRRFGYELRQTVRPIKDGPPYYTMWRAPR